MKKQKGITLIALIITIIVMLILVAVTVTVAINGGLFNVAKDGAKRTQLEADREVLQAGIIPSIDTNTLQIPTAQTLKDNLPEGWETAETDGGPYTAISPKGNSFKIVKSGKIFAEGETVVPNGWNEIEKPEEWENNENVVAITDGTKKVPLPKGYEIVEEEGKKTKIENGLVIKDSKGNEFVWIPVETTFTSSYSSGSGYSEPTELTDIWRGSTLETKPRFDSQEILTELYGTKEDGTPYYSYPETEEEKEDANSEFAYKGHYAEMVESVNKYGGFYIGRYETTIDEETNEIGSKVNTIVLTADKSIPQTNNKLCRWYGLYNVQRNSNVVGNKEYVQTNMVWGQQWDAMLSFLGEEQAKSKIEGSQAKVLKSGEAIYDGVAKDVMNNIYDLRRNARDWTAESYSLYDHINRGGHYNSNDTASYRISFHPNLEYKHFSSRLALYIK